MKIETFEKYYLVTDSKGTPHVVRRDLESFGGLEGQSRPLGIEMAEEIIRLKEIERIYADTRIIVNDTIHYS